MFSGFGILSLGVSGHFMFRGLGFSLSGNLLLLKIFSGIGTFPFRNFFARCGESRERWRQDEYL